ncbi:hypothetical protein mRhiFer1_009252 [Rhinolophus ferrumequinum]|uniref:Uncharacterized protein n=1 Tax=Rhinolophus ferrumequinum TaxID=59479 RepID=A0A7J7S823_RHIFE|nr:hypothetical protein mRhiFer1_009252 [Rhinolophus ferrumequinum]
MGKALSGPLEITALSAESCETLACPTRSEFYVGSRSDLNAKHVPLPQGSHHQPDTEGVPPCPQTCHVVHFCSRSAPTSGTVGETLEEHHRRMREKLSSPKVTLVTETGRIPGSSRCMTGVV